MTKSVQLAPGISAEITVRLDMSELEILSDLCLEHKRRLGRLLQSNEAMIDMQAEVDALQDSIFKQQASLQAFSESLHEMRQYCNAPNVTIDADRTAPL